MRTHFLAATAVLTLGLTSLLAQLAPRGDGPIEEIYQDFRNKRPLLASLRLVGPDVDGETRAEDEGLRITLEAKRNGHWPVEVAANFPLTGDFEVTGTYELLSARRPAKGYGVGVHMNVADTEERVKFAKVTRAFMPAEGSVYLTQYWHSEKDYQIRSKKTETMVGQLRLTRVGSSLRYLASDAPGEKFHEIWSQKDFSAVDLGHFRFGVSDSGEPGNPVDARIVELRIRMGGVSADRALDPAPLAPPEPLEDSGLPAGTTSPGHRLALIALGLAVVLVPAVALFVWRFRRRRDAQDAATSGAGKSPEVSLPPVSFSCSSCGKKLRIRADMAGKKIKCVECGKVVFAPAS